VNVSTDGVAANSLPVIVVIVTEDNGSVVRASVYVLVAPSLMLIAAFDTNTDAVIKK
jgi:hypothetical protein